jgi:FKBP-type peptidyl-prolyl cis-trans isomerase FklB
MPLKKDTVPSTKDKVSYCIGLETGRNLRQQFGEMNLDLLKEGFSDALSGGTPQLEQQEIQSLLTALRQQIESQQRQHFTKISEENKKAGEAFFSENKGKEGVHTLSSGLQYKILSSTGSSSEHPTALDTVKIHYRGSLLDGRVFDSSYQRGEPLIIPLNRAIPGWAEAVSLMSVGDKWQVFIPAYLAYGETGFGPEIGPNMALVFEMELLGINED